MATKYKLKSLSILLNNRVFKIEENVEFSADKGFKKEELELACKQGFLVEVKNVKAEAEAKAKAEAEAKAKNVKGNK